MSAARRFSAIGASLGLAAATALTVTTTTTADAARGDARTGRLVRVFVAENHAVLMSQRLRPGVHEFAVRSGSSGGFQLARPDAGYTKLELARDTLRGLNQGRIPALRRFEANVTLLGGVSTAPGVPTRMWADLEPGTYWAIDVNAPRIRANKVLTVNVGGSPLQGGMPRSATITAVNDADWSRVPAAIPHRGRLTFDNNGTSNHFVILAKLARGKTIQDFRRWINRVQRGVDAPPPLDPRHEIDSGVVSPGEAMTMRFSLPRGRYVLTCFWPDSDMGGMPHAFMGMHRGIRLR